MALRDAITLGMLRATTTVRDDREMIPAIVHGKGASIAIALFLGLFFVTSAHADAGDNYVACIVGRAAVALHAQTQKDSGKALEAAFKHCKEPKGIGETELEGISDYANMMVDRMAAE